MSSAHRRQREHELLTVLWIPLHFEANPDVDPNSTYHPDAELDADPYFYLMRMRIQIRLFTLMLIQIRIQILASIYTVL
jgi:hypothetical protein